MKDGQVRIDLDIEDVLDISWEYFLNATNTYQADQDRSRLKIVVN